MKRSYVPPMALMLLLVPPMGAQTRDQCKDALLPTLEKAVASRSLELAWLHLIDETNYEKAKKQASTSGSVFYGPIFAEGDASYGEFEQARSTFFEKEKVDLSQDEALAIFRQTLTPDQLREWGDCIQNQRGVRLDLKEDSPRGVNVDLP